MHRNFLWCHQYGRLCTPFCKKYVVQPIRGHWTYFFAWRQTMASSGNPHIWVAPWVAVDESNKLGTDGINHMITSLLREQNSASTFGWCDEFMPRRWVDDSLPSLQKLGNFEKWAHIRAYLSLLVPATVANKKRYSVWNIEWTGKLIWKSVVFVWTIYHVKVESAADSD